MIAKGLLLLAAIILAATLNSNNFVLPPYAFSEILLHNDTSILAAPDPISLQGLGELDLDTAQIYNNYGKYIYEKAAELKLPPSRAAAVIQVESSGRNFGEDGRLLIRFEPCVFYDIWGRGHQQEFSKHFQCGRPDDKFRESAAQNFTEFHGDYYKEWKVFQFARTLDEDAALKSISMGLPQVMGFNYYMLGYSSAKEMFNAMSTSTKSQLDALFSALSYRDPTGKSCLDPLRAGDFVSFAGCYNGEGRNQEYGSKISQAAEFYKQVTSGRKYSS